MQQPYSLSRRDRYPEKQKPIRVWVWLLLGIGFGLLSLAGYTTYTVGQVMGSVYKPPPAATATKDAPTQVRPIGVQANEHINVLVMGTDNDGGRTDTMMLASFNPLTHKVAVISIPRDTRALLAGRGTVEKINGAYAYGLGDKDFPAPYRAMSTVQELLHVPVHYYISINLGAFRKMVNAAGGVSVDVPIRMDYDDPYQDLHIHLPKGRQKLDGEKAMGFVRFRHNNDGSGYPTGDLGRIEAQQRFMQDTLSQLLTVTNLPRLPGFVQDAAKDVETNMEPSRMLSLAGWAVTMRTSDVQFRTLPGSPAMLWDKTEGQQLSFFVVDPVAVQKLMDEQVLGVDRAANAQVRVEVRYPAQAAEEAQRVARELGWNGYQVLPLAVTSTSPDATQVTEYRTGSGGERVTRSLLVYGEKVSGFLTQPDTGARADVSVWVAKSRTAAGN